MLNVPALYCDCSKITDSQIIGLCSNAVCYIVQVSEKKPSNTTTTTTTTNNNNDNDNENDNNNDDKNK